MLNSPSQTRTTDRVAAAAAGTLARVRAIRVGIVIDSVRPPRWVKQILDDIHASATLTPSVLLVEQRGSGRRAEPRNSNGSSMLLRLWTRLDNFVRANDKSAVAPVSIELADYGEVARLGKASRGGYAPHQIVHLKELDLDVIINLASSVACETLAATARRGVWAFAGCEPLLRNDIAGFFWQQRTSPVFADDLVEFSGGTERVVHRALLASDPESPYRARNSLLWRRSAFLVQRLCALGDERLKDRRLELVPQRSAEPPRQAPTPTNLQTARLLAGVLANGFSRIVQRKLTAQHWFTAVRESHGGPLGNDMSGFKAIRSPRDRYYADPFVIEHEGQQYVFVEDYRSNEGKAVISYFVYDGSQDVDATVALETDYHLSYPFLFRWKGDIFLMPETSYARRIEVFRAVEFPNRWQPHAVLLDNVVGYDPTLLEYGGKFWLFLSGVLKYGAQNNDLSIYYADSPFGPWQPHPGNPVVSDPRRARPAGAVFSQGGNLYRPGQDCWGAYGRAVTLSRIEELSETQYRETPVSRIEPEWLPGITGTHTFNDNGRIQVIDGRVLTPRWRRKNR